jgi:hypothetical protein
LWRNRTWRLDCIQMILWERWINFAFYKRVEFLIQLTDRQIFKQTLFCGASVRIYLLGCRVWSDKFDPRLHHCRILRVPSVYPWPCFLTVKKACATWVRSNLHPVQWQLECPSDHKHCACVQPKRNRGQSFRCRGQWNGNYRHLNDEKLTTWSHFFVLVSDPSTR